MRTILVTTDLSANSKAAICFAGQLQRQTGCNLVFYHVIEVMKPTSWSEARFESYTSQQNSARVTKLIAFVKSMLPENGTNLGKNSYHTEVGVGVANMIIAYAQKVKADALCIATKGAGKIKALLGSVATDLLVRAPMAVMVVPPRYHVRPVKEIFYASDLEKFAPEFKTSLSFARTLSARLTVLYYDFLLMDKAAVEKLKQEYRSYEAADVQFMFHKRNLDLNLAECIRQDLKKYRPGILILFTKLTEGWFNRLFSSSRTEQLALHPTTPLLVFRKAGNS